MSYFGVPLRNGVGLGLGTVPSLTNTPLSYRLGPSLNLIFVNATTLDPRITFTRSTTGTRTNASGLIESVAINGPRFNYNPTTLESLGLLIEEQRVNLLLQSQDFTTTWSNVASTETANTDTAPDGTTTADTITANAGTALKGIQQNITLSGTYTYSVFAKAKTHSIIQLLFGGTGNAASAFANFNIAAGSGAVGNTSGTSSIVDAGNDWYRCVFTGDFTGGTSAYVSFIDSTTAARAASTTSTGTIILWGAQLEAGAFATSYIPTVASQVTRAADVAVMTGTNFSSWYNATAGTLYVDASPQASNSAGYALFELNNATAANRIGLFKLITTGNASMAVLAAGATQASTNNGAWPSSGKLAGAYAVNDFASALNGGAVATDTSGTLPTVTQATIGARGDGANRLTGTIKRIAFYPQRLSNAELQGITS